MRVRSLGQEDPLEKEMATHPSILAWRIPWTKEPGGLQSVGSQRVRHDLATKQKQPCNTHIRISSLSKRLHFFNCCGACELCTVVIYSANKHATLP